MYSPSVEINKVLIIHATIVEIMSFAATFLVVINLTPSPISIGKMMFDTVKIGLNAQPSMSEQRISDTPPTIPPPIAPSVSPATIQAR